MSFLLKMSLSLKYTDFPDICRICLLKKDKMFALHTSNIIEMLQMCTKIKISPNDGLPTQICSTCKSRFTKFLVFKKFCENSDKILHKILNNIKKDLSTTESLFNIKDTLNPLKDVSSSELISYNDAISDTSLKSEDDRLSDYSENVSSENFFLSKQKQNSIEINKNQTYSCGVCKKNFDNVMSLWSHERIHEQESNKQILEDYDADPVSCEVCKKIYKNKKQLDRHMHTHKERTHKCQVCGKCFIGKSRLDRHLIVHKPKEEKMPCLFCDKTFAYEVNLRQHHKKYHEGELKRIVCTVCGKDFVNIKTHLKTHTKDPNIKPYKCSQCPKAFQLNSTLLKHILMKHNENPPSATKLCNICGKCCFTTGELRSHMLVHTDIRSFACNLCDKKFKLKSALNFHFRTHTGNRPHTCSICSKSFYASTTLKRHMFIHTGERPFKCNVCEKAFRQRSTLKVHMKIH